MDSGRLGHPVGQAAGWPGHHLHPAGLGDHRPGHHPVEPAPGTCC